VAEAQLVVRLLDRIGQVVVDLDVVAASRDCGNLTIDGNLIGRPVSSGSATHPRAAFGPMGDCVRLEHQVAMLGTHRE
jgi:hypothetical protein